MAGCIVPYLGHPNQVGVTGILRHDVAEATRHSGGASGEDFDEIVAPARRGGYLGNHSVHGTLPSSGNQCHSGGASVVYSRGNSASLFRSSCQPGARRGTRILLSCSAQKFELQPKRGKTWKS